MNFTDDIAKGVNTIANGVFGNVETKAQAQFLMLEMIKLSCQQYQKDEYFRKWINHVGDRNNQKSMGFQTVLDKDQKKPEKMRG